MGLDAVEIVMRVEDVFDIAIEDSEAEIMMTPKDVIEYVMIKVGRTDRAQCLTQRAFHHLRASLIRNAELKRAEIRPDVSTGNLFPLGKRRELLRKTLADLGLTTMPEMVRPKWLVGLMLAGSVGAGLAASVCVVRVSGSSNVMVNLMKDSPAFLGIFVAMLCGWLAVRVTRALRYEFKPALANAGGLSRWIVAHGGKLLGAPPGQWSREQVAEKIREIVSEQLGCGKIYREDAHFVKELGLS